MSPEKHHYKTNKRYESGEILLTLELGAKQLSADIFCYNYTMDKYYGPKRGIHFINVLNGLAGYFYFIWIPIKLYYGY